VHGFSNSPCNGAGAGDAHDECAFSFKKSHVSFLYCLLWTDQGRVQEIGCNVILWV
jgi:hypothetical protein